MTQTEEQQIYQAAIEKFGDYNQRLKLVEEMAELSRAIIKYHFVLLNSDLDTTGDDIKILENMYDEFADVDIVMGQFRLLLHPDTLAAKKQQKLERLKELVK